MENFHFISYNGERRTCNPALWALSNPENVVWKSLILVVQKAVILTYEIGGDAVIHFMLLLCTNGKVSLRFDEIPDSIF